ncbi:MAG TPA: glycosyltransferase [Melioribacteraceae bacterium]|nr:glycosyltransferase [Melioribacteraceae bacterium]
MIEIPLNPDNLPPDVVKYLRKYSGTKWKVKLPSVKKFLNIIVVPAISEYQNIKSFPGSLLQSDDKHFESTLVLFVINAKDDSPEDVKSDNSKSIDFLNNFNTGNNLSIGFIDASSNGLSMPVKEGGVGLARKIGMDLALTLFDYSSLRKKLMICLDADCRVEANYLSEIVDYFNNEKISAAVVEYRHQLPENENDRRGIIAYEIFLRYYVAGLFYAGSPFAYHSVGSTMVCDYESYIKVGGMNKRKAAEDFYFLEKLAKITEIKKIKSTTVHPSSRESWRVPFGTGQRMNRFNAGTHNEYLLFDPRLFDLLKTWLEIYYGSDFMPAAEYLQKADSIHPEIAAFLKQNLFESQWDAIISNSRNPDQIKKQKMIWFDGFRTMKLVHHLRDNVYPLINMFDALDLLFKRMNYEISLNRTDSIPSIDIQLEYLKGLRILNNR